MRVNFKHARVGFMRHVGSTEFFKNKTQTINRLEVSRACDAGLRAISARVAVPHFTDPNSPGYAPFNAFLTLAVDAGAA